MSEISGGASDYFILFRKAGFGKEMEEELSH